MYVVIIWVQVLTSHPPYPVQEMLSWLWSLWDYQVGWPGLTCWANFQMGYAFFGPTHWLIWMSQIGSLSFPNFLGLAWTVGLPFFAWFYVGCLAWLVWSRLVSTTLLIGSTIITLIDSNTILDSSTILEFGMAYLNLTLQN